MREEETEAEVAPAPSPPASVSIRRSEVRLRTLPAPDRLDCTLPPGHVALLTDDGTPASLHLARALRAASWPVVLLRFPEALVAPAPGREIPEGVPCAALGGTSDADLGAALAGIASEHGPVGAFVHMHPPAAGAHFAPETRAIVKAVFFCARHLAAPLTAAARAAGGNERAAFVAVTRLDGALGLTGAPCDPLAGGLPGLVKTLAQEWPAVFCRAVDLAPGADDAASADDVRAELLDPNRRLVEVGRGARGRVTPEV